MESVLAGLKLSGDADELDGLCFLQSGNDDGFAPVLDDGRPVEDRLLKLRHDRPQQHQQVVLVVISSQNPKLSCDGLCDRVPRRTAVVLRIERPLAQAINERGQQVLSFPEIAVKHAPMMRWRRDSDCDRHSRLAAMRAATSASSTCMASSRFNAGENGGCIAI